MNERVIKVGKDDDLLEVMRGHYEAYVEKHGSPPASLVVDEGIIERYSVKLGGSIFKSYLFRDIPLYTDTNCLFLESDNAESEAEHTGGISEAHGE